jgi:hypothetical protein
MYRWSGKGSDSVIGDVFFGTDILSSQHNATVLSDRLRKQAKARGETLYRGLNQRMFALEA